MPKIDQTNTIEITPERFLNACSPAELFDVDRLIQQKRYQNKIKEMFTGALDEHAEPVVPEQLPGKTYYCSICKQVPVDVDNGFDTCETCLKAFQ